MLLASEAVPPHWARHLRGGPVGLGYDVATTVKKESNPSSITVLEDYAGTYWTRLVVRFKADDPEVAALLLSSILAPILPARRRRLCIDATNEKYHARSIQRRFRSLLPVELVTSSEAVDFEGERYNYKQLLGELYVSLFEDGRITLPAEEWLLRDHRLVRRHAGSFATEVDEAGNHGDTFDSGKLAYWGLRRGGSVRAAAVPLGAYQSPAGGRPGLLNPWLRRSRGVPALTT